MSKESLDSSKETRCSCWQHAEKNCEIDEKDGAWENLDSKPTDVYADGVDMLFQSGAFDVGDNYPRGV